LIRKHDLFVLAERQTRKHSAFNDAGNPTMDSQVL
jgi:hypothetical protein